MRNIRAVSFDPGAARYLGCAFEEKSKCLANGTAPGFHDGVAISSWDGGQISPTLTRNNAGGGQRMPDKDNFNAVITDYVVRRLTPLECCRLQGFPDWWCEGVEGSDSAQYKMWGNGVALPCVLYIMEGIKEAGDKYNL